VRDVKSISLATTYGSSRLTLDSTVSILCVYLCVRKKERTLN
jgi:hypothetical protein